MVLDEAWQYLEGLEAALKGRTPSPEMQLFFALAFPDERRD